MRKSDAPFFLWVFRFPSSRSLSDLFRYQTQTILLVNYLIQTNVIYYRLLSALPTSTIKCLDKCTRVLFSFRGEWNRREKRLAFGFLERSRELITRSGCSPVHFTLSYERLIKGKNVSLASPISLYSSFYPFGSGSVDRERHFAGKLQSLGKAWSSEDELNIE